MKGLGKLTFYTTADAASRQQSDRVFFTAEFEVVYLTSETTHRRHDLSFGYSTRPRAINNP